LALFQAQRGGGKAVYRLGPRRKIQRSGENEPGVAKLGNLMRLLIERKKNCMEGIGEVRGKKGRRDFLVMRRQLKTAKEKKGVLPSMMPREK